MLYERIEFDKGIGVEQRKDAFAGAALAALALFRIRRVMLLRHFVGNSLQALIRRQVMMCGQPPALTYRLDNLLISFTICPLL